MTIGIYCIMNDINGDVYVGQSENCERRISVHFSTLRSGKHPNKVLLDSFRSFGQWAFSSEILEVMPKDVQDTGRRSQEWAIWLGQRESYYAKILNANTEFKHRDSLDLHGAWISVSEYRRRVEFVDSQLVSSRRYGRLRLYRSKP